MSERGRYRKLYVRLWKHPGFVRLSEGEKVLVFYLLTGPQTNRVGVYSFSIATAAEDLGSIPATLRKRLANVCAAFGWHFDAKARVFYVPSWWRWNPPENANVLKGNVKDLSELPSCGLVDAFARNMQALPETFHGTFVDELRQRRPADSPNQKPYQNQYQNGEQEQEPALRAAEMVEGNNAHHVDLPPQDVKLAQETLRMTDPNGPMDDLIDAFLNLCRFRGLHRSRARAIDALALALSERGQQKLT